MYVTSTVKCAYNLYTKSYTEVHVKSLAGVFNHKQLLETVDLKNDSECSDIALLIPLSQ